LPHDAKMLTNTGIKTEKQRLILLRDPILQIDWKISCSTCTNAIKTDHRFQNGFNALQNHVTFLS
jgi:hypothetical protein